MKWHTILFFVSRDRIIFYLKCDLTLFMIIIILVPGDYKQINPVLPTNHAPSSSPSFLVGGWHYPLKFIYMRNKRRMNGLCVISCHTTSTKPAVKWNPVGLAQLLDAGRLADMTAWKFACSLPPSLSLHSTYYVKISLDEIRGWACTIQHNETGPVWKVWNFSRCKKVVHVALELFSNNFLKWIQWKFRICILWSKSWKSEMDLISLDFCTPPAKRKHVLPLLSLTAQTTKWW